MDAKTANKFYESNRKYFYDKITLLDLALAAMEGAIGEAYEQETLQGLNYNLEDFRDRQAQMIFEEIMNLSPFQVEEASRGTYL